MVFMHRDPLLVFQDNVQAPHYLYDVHYSAELTDNGVARTSIWAVVSIPRRTNKNYISLLSRQQAPFRNPFILLSGSSI